MAFKAQSSMVVGMFSDRRIFLVRDGFKVSWSFSIRWRLSDGVSDEYPALAIRSLNSMITSSAVMRLPAVKRCSRQVLMTSSRGFRLYLLL